MHGLNECWAKSYSNKTTQINWTVIRHRNNNVWIAWINTGWKEQRNVQYNTKRYKIKLKLLGGLHERIHCKGKIFERPCRVNLNLSICMCVCVCTNVLNFASTAKCFKWVTILLWIGCCSAFNAVNWRMREGSWFARTHVHIPAKQIYINLWQRSLLFSGMMCLSIFLVLLLSLLLFIFVGFRFWLICGNNTAFAYMVVMTFGVLVSVATFMQSLILNSNFQLHLG